MHGYTYLCAHLHTCVHTTYTSAWAHTPAHNTHRQQVRGSNVQLYLVCSNRVLQLGQSLRSGGESDARPCSLLGAP